MTAPPIQAYQKIIFGSFISSGTASFSACFPFLWQYQRQQVSIDMGSSSNSDDGIYESCRTGGSGSGITPKEKHMSSSHLQKKMQKLRIQQSETLQKASRLDMKIELNRRERGDRVLHRDRTFGTPPLTNS